MLLMSPHFSVRAALLPAMMILSSCVTGGTTYKSPTDWVTESKTGSRLVLAAGPDVWSEPRTYASPAGPITIQSKFLYQKGTTCTYDIQFSNTGSGKVGANVQLGKETTTEVYGHRLTEVSLEPGAKAVYEMEQRECQLKWGESKDMNLCAACKPTVVFLGG